MEKPEVAKQKLGRCINCNEPLNNFIAYIPGEGEACLKCYIEFAKSKEVQQSLPNQKKTI